MYLSWRYLVFLFLGLANCPNIQASTFSPECTLPPPNTTFVASPNARGTLSILSSCLSIVILCAWNIQHLNIPSRRPCFDDKGRKYRWLITSWWSLLDMRINFWWLILNILAPEYVIGRALSERLAATTSLETLRSRFGDEMEIVHAYIMNMGGFYLDFSEVDFAGIEVGQKASSKPSHLSTTAVDYSGIHFSANYIKESLGPGHKSQSLGSFQEEISKPDISSDSLELCSPPTTVAKAPLSKRIILEASNLKTGSSESLSVEDNSKDYARRILGHKSISVSMEHLSSFQVLNMKRLQHKKWALTALQLLSAKGFKLYAALPEIPAHDLVSLSKRDSLTTGLAMLNIGWLAVELMARHQQSLVSSQLEIGILALAICSIITYIIAWNRPQGVTMRYKITAIKRPTPDEIVLLATFGPGYLWTWHRLPDKVDQDLDLMPIPNDASHAVDARNLFSGFEHTIIGRTLVEWLRHNHPAVAIIIAGSALGGTIFGALHCLAWNFSFPTMAELILWRICAVATTVIPLLSVYFNLQWSYYNGENGWERHEDGSISRQLHGPVILICFGVPYVLARLFLMTEMVRTVFFLPPEAFISTWPGAFLIWG